MATAPAQDFANRDGFIWMDGKLIPWRDANVHVLTHGLHYASSIFEGERVYNGKVFKLREHTQRLLDSATIMDLSIPYTPAQLEQATLDVVAAMKIDEGYVRPVAWRGSEVMGVAARGGKTHVAIAAWVWPHYFAPEKRLEGLRLRKSKWARPAANTAPVAAKAAGLYMICTLSKHEAENAGFEDALMLDYRGYIAEATGANIFLVQKGELHTPLPDCFLNGITRQTVIELAKMAKIAVTERHIKPEEFANTQEVFLTGTAAEIAPVREIVMDAQTSYSFKDRAVTKKLMDMYGNLVRGRDPMAGA